MSTPGWETVKENAAPLQRGRNVTALERVAARGSGGGALQARNNDSEKQIAEFERLVRRSEAPHVTETEDDPLMHWMAYIKYYQDNFPSDTHQQFLLMERCTRSLVKMPQYANDDRFISVCAKYADKTKEPGQVFKYLHQQKVGGKTALFWIAWAYVAEKDNDFPFAEQIYKKGISKDAQPMNTLKIRHKQFQRRMSRHWLSSSQRNDQLDEYDDEEESTVPSRGTLGGLSHDRARRNDRSRTGPQLAQQRSRVASIRPTSTRSLQNTNTSVNNGPFAIFVENEGENAPQNFLDQPLVEHKRVIEREVDRRKENTLDAERWNERGGLHNSTSHVSAAGYLSRSGPDRSSSRGAPLPFAVFVDEECVAQHVRDETEQSMQAERHRGARDERTFRERSDEGVAERLTRDPLRYVRDPTQFDADLVTAKGQANNQNHTDLENDRAKRSRVGFNKKLLKDSDGVEQSFEEARVESNFYKLAPRSVNFNLMQVSRVDQSSQMDLDDGLSTDVSMTGSSSPSQNSLHSEQPRKMQRTDPKSEARVLFRSEASFESLSQTNVSTASSVVHESDAVGVLTRREEETINTKLAMRELSMMFSSPAFGVEDVARKTEQHTTLKDKSRIEDERVRDISFGNVGDGLGHLMLDNSILHVEDDTTENIGPRNPFARTNDTPGFDKMALRELMMLPDTDRTLGCDAHNSRVAMHQGRQNPLQASETDLKDDPGFQIYEDENIQHMPTVAAFQIYDEDGDEDVDSFMPAVQPPGESLGFQIFEDLREENSEKKPCSIVGSVIYEDEDEDDLGDGSKSGGSDPYAQGDTATFSLLGDTLGNDDCEAMTSTPGQSSIQAENEEGNTATLSIFNEVFSELSSANDTSLIDDRKSSKGMSGGFSIFIDNEDDHHSTNSSTSSWRDTNVVRDSTSSNFERSVDYDSTHRHNIKMALRRLQASSSVASNSRLPLLALLSGQRKSFHLPHIPLPRELRSKRLSGNTQVQIGKHLGVMHRELGRGAYGVVALMDLSEKGGKTTGTIAVKAQTPTDCLAWECEVLRRLEDRAKEEIRTYAFPCAISFLSLADGAILSMTAGSNTGLNLVDLANVYKVKLGEHVPEIITLHYVSRMLRHLEQLHWHGKILHCDVKPDNFVMCTLDCDDNGFREVEFSDLMLVDFGRAIDLEDHCNDGLDARGVMFHGDACLEEMKCVAMRAGRPWSYDIDTFGVLACAHVMLYGSHIKVKKMGKDRWSIGNTFKRYWQKALWTKIFDTLLNLDDESGAAIGSRARSLRSLRDEINSYTEKESDKLKSFLTRQLTLLPSSREQMK